MCHIGKENRLWRVVAYVLYKNLWHLSVLDTVNQVKVKEITASRAQKQDCIQANVLERDESSFRERVSSFRHKRGLGLKPSNQEKDSLCRRERKFQKVIFSLQHFTNLHFLPLISSILFADLIRFLILGRKVEQNSKHKPDILTSNTLLKQDNRIVSITSVFGTVLEWTSQSQTSLERPEKGSPTWQWFFRGEQ